MKGDFVFAANELEMLSEIIGSILWVDVKIMLIYVRVGLKYRSSESPIVFPITLTLTKDNIANINKSNYAISFDKGIW